MSSCGFLVVLVFRCLIAINVSVVVILSELRSRIHTPNRLFVKDLINFVINTIIQYKNKHNKFDLILYFIKSIQILIKTIVGRARPLVLSGWRIIMCARSVTLLFVYYEDSRTGRCLTISYLLPYTGLNCQWYLFTVAATLVVTTLVAELFGGTNNCTDKMVVANCQWHQL